MSDMSDDKKMAPQIRMVTDLESVEIMQMIGKKIGVKIEIVAKEGERYSFRGGESTSMVAKGQICLVITAERTKVEEFWIKVRDEKTRRRLIVEAAMAKELAKAAAASAASQ